MTDAAAIAQGLTKAQRAMLLEARSEDKLVWIANRKDAETAETLMALGLLFITMRGAMLNHLGLAVRAELEKM